MFLVKATSGEGTYPLQNQNIISHVDAVEQLWRTRHLGTAGSQAQLLSSLSFSRELFAKRKGLPWKTLSQFRVLNLWVWVSIFFCRPWRPVCSVPMVGRGIPQNSLWVWWLLLADFKKFLASSSFSFRLSSPHNKAGRILDLTWQWEVLALTFNWKDPPWPGFYACVETLAAKIIFQCLPICPVTLPRLQTVNGQCDLLGKHLLKIRANKVLWGGYWMSPR